MARRIFLMTEPNNFYNEGFGWICRRCEEDLEVDGETITQYSRVFREGESESKTPELANKALAKWSDLTRRILICPRCGITESVKK